MAYKHGIYGSEVANSLVPMTTIAAGLPVVFGTAPVHLATNPAAANSLVLCSEYKEAVTQLGYSADWENYTLCEFMKSQFVLFNMAPVVFVNVLDISKHKKSVAAADVNLTDGTIMLSVPVIASTLKVKLAAADEAALVLNADYTAAHDSDGNLIITPLVTGKASAATKLNLAYDVVDPTMVTKNDVIGGVDLVTGAYKGLELVNMVYSKLKLIPGIILAPKWSSDSGVAAVMRAKQTNIDGHFEAISLCDIDTTAVVKYSDCVAWKEQNNHSDPREILLWPMLGLSGEKYHLSTQTAGVICKTDAANDDIPYVSPSNKALQCDSMILANGTEVEMGTSAGTYLNGCGIVTAANYGGWKLWGNRTTAYPDTTDVKDSMIPIRRMFNWVNNTLITTFWSKIDDPMNKAFIKTIMDSANIWLNGLAKRGVILGGRIEFREDENTTTDLMDGIIRFHVYLTPPSPARDIEFVQEYDPDYISTLFSA